MPTIRKFENLHSEAEQALSTDEDQEFSASIARVCAQVKAGDVVDGQRAAAWVASRGTENEMPRPTPVREP